MENQGEARSALKELQHYTYESFGAEITLGDERPELFAALEAALTPPWIPCAERLPTEEENPVLVATKERSVMEASLYDAEWVYNCGIMPRGEVTHWMPMPEPPEVEA